ncbi:GNAT family N-acetyltransferase [Cytophaga sp. FL35]|uniref:GNAT family N-acetyltransferase n=1 Tax=Cytophaga sp. FL35 TaxID=1904456 RepID=UPI0016537508|nr:GNAT family N-acetyltransferase [Cytophaga sp. FL35]MBC6997228.1 GNAT family N-acetyltransferase [Cytophaga sp. FL35]
MLDIKKASMANAEEIAVLHALSWQQNYRGSFSDQFLDNEVGEERQKVWRERLSNPQPNQSVWVARSGGEFAGFICTFFQDDETYGSLVDNLHVSPIMKGKGVGSQLLRVAAEEVNQKYPDTGIYLWVLEKNEGAHPFYKALGGKVIETIKGNDIGDLEIRKVRYHWEKAQDLVNSVLVKKN